MLIDKILTYTRKSIESIFDNLGLLFAPITPAVLSFSSVYVALEPQLSTLAYAVAAAVGFSIEAMGYVSFKSAQATGQTWRSIVYLLVGSIVTVTLEYHDLTRLTLGLCGFAISAVIYNSHAAMLNVERQRAARAAAAADLHEQERSKAEFERELKLREFEAEQQRQRDADQRDHDIKQQREAARLERLASKQIAKTAPAAKLAAANGSAAAKSAPVAKIAKSSLQADDWQYIVNANVDDICARYGVSKRTAAYWKKESVDKLV